jgi:transcriptional regulator with XRE-family HTH domain
VEDLSQTGNAKSDSTEGARICGILVLEQRARLGLSRRELAARLDTSPSTLARIEQGHAPSAELWEKLVAEFDPEPKLGPIGRLTTRLGRPMRVPVRSRSLRGGLALAPLIALLLIGVLSNWDRGLIGGSSSTGRGASVPRDSLAAIVEPAIPVDLRRERVRPREAGTGADRVAVEPSQSSVPRTSVSSPDANGPVHRPEIQSKMSPQPPSVGGVGEGAGGSGGATGGGSSGGGALQGVQQGIGSLVDALEPGAG